MFFYLWCWFNKAASSEEKEYEESDLYVYSADLETIHCVNVAHGKWEQSSHSISISSFWWVSKRD